MVGIPGADCHTAECDGGEKCVFDPNNPSGPAICQPDPSDPCYGASLTDVCNPATNCWDENICKYRGGTPGSKQPGSVPGKKTPETKTPDTTVPDTTTPDATPPAAKPASNAGLIFGAIALAVAGFVGIGYASGMFDGD